MLETHAYKKFNFEHFRKTKMSQILFKVFWSNREAKMPRNVVFRLNREIIMPRNSKFFLKKPCEIKTPQKFLTLKYNTPIKTFSPEVKSKNLSKGNQSYTTYNR